MRDIANSLSQTSTTSSGSGGLVATGRDLATLNVTWSLDIGVPGDDSSAANPLARAVRRLLLGDGQPFSRLSLCFFRDDNALAHWLGVFVHSAGGRVLFFPAMPETIDQLQAFRAETEVAHRHFAFDHASLECDLQRWHVTSTGSADHVGNAATLPLGDGRVLWFGMSVASTSALRLLRQTSTVTADVPDSDAKRRWRVLKDARENAAFPMVSMNMEDASAPTEPRFLHFAVIVGPSGFADYRGTELGFPFGNPYVVGGLEPLPRGLPLRSHRFALSATLDVQIVCAWVPGRLSVPITFTTPSNGP